MASNKCEQMNGTTWSNIADLNSNTHYNMVFGDADDCMSTSTTGYPSAMNKVEKYNGTIWTEMSELLVTYQIQQSGCFGTTSSAVIFGGDGKNVSGDSWGVMEESQQWNGTAWSSEDNYTVAVKNLSGCGARASGTGGGLGTGGQASGVIDTTQEYG